MSRLRSSSHGTASRLVVSASALLFTVGCASTQQPGVLASPSIQAAVDAAYEKWRDQSGGKNADYIPYLASVPSELFGIAVCTVDGKFFTAGDIDYGFSIQSVSKPFTAALVMQEQGADTLREKIGVEPSGMPFNSALAIERHATRTVNPMVNAGAMATVSLVDATDAAERWDKIQRWLARFAGEPLEFNAEVYESEAASNQRNQGIARLLEGHGRFYSAPADPVDVYTRQRSLNVTPKQLAVMGATLANGGGEVLSGHNEHNDGATGDAVRLQFSRVYWMFRAGPPAGRRRRFGAPDP